MTGVRIGVPSLSNNDVCIHIFGVLVKVRTKWDGTNGTVDVCHCDQGITYSFLPGASQVVP